MDAAECIRNKNLLHSDWLCTFFFAAPVVFDSLKLLETFPPTYISCKSLHYSTVENKSCKAEGEQEDCFDWLLSPLLVRGAVMSMISDSSSEPVLLSS